MILLLSSEMGDASFPGIVDWLNFYKANYYILNGEDIFKGKEGLDFTLENDKVHFKTDSFDINEINVIYSRRWFQQKVSEIIASPKLQFEGLENILKSEFYTLSQILINQFANAYWIPTNNKTSVNKFEVLQSAMEVGFKIPNTIITSKKSKLREFSLKNSGRIISKAIDNFNAIDINKNFKFQPMYTKMVEKRFIESMAENFFPSLFQEYIEKDEEYRVFYFEKNIYATAIFSQEVVETQIDSRRFSKPEESPRMMPVELPEMITCYIIKLMERLNLNIGSIDLIRKGDSYYFLEINPVGQFEAYSKFCNYDVQNEIVKFMIKIDEGKN